MADAAWEAKGDGGHWWVKGPRSLGVHDFGFVDGEHEAFDEADARLMAAARRMAHMLAEVVEAFDDYEPRASAAFWDAVARLKAEGVIPEQPDYPERRAR